MHAHLCAARAHECVHLVNEDGGGRVVARELKQHLHEHCMGVRAHVLVVHGGAWHDDAGG
jgi:Ni,Fe-hydrogenase maturation factor